MKNQILSMRKIANDIWLIESILPEAFANDIVDRIDEIGEMNCLSLKEHADLYLQFDTFWKTQMDPMFFDFFYDIGEDGFSKLYSHSEETISELRRDLVFEWKNIYALNYYEENTRKLKDVVHSDFCNYTFSCGLLDENLFDGGNLVFPKQDLAIKIKRLDMLLFPGGLTHPHYTEAVTQGRRINLVGQSKYFKY